MQKRHSIESTSTILVNDFKILCGILDKSWRRAPSHPPCHLSPEVLDMVQIRWARWMIQKTNAISLPMYISIYTLTPMYNLQLYSSLVKPLLCPLLCPPPTVSSTNCVLRCDVLVMPISLKNIRAIKVKKFSSENKLSSTSHHLMFDDFW